jgi:hypothetical protein
MYVALRLDRPRNFMCNLSSKGAKMHLSDHSRSAHSARGRLAVETAQRGSL